MLCYSAVGPAVLRCATLCCERLEWPCSAVLTSAALCCAVLCWRWAGQVGVPGVENVNLSRVVDGHMDYLTKMDEILDILNLSTE
jgi:hypothetical protein